MKAGRHAGANRVAEADQADRMTIFLHDGQVVEAMARHHECRLLERGADKHRHGLGGHPLPRATLAGMHSLSVTPKSSARRADDLHTIH